MLFVFKSLVSSSKLRTSPLFRVCFFSTVELCDLFATKISGSCCLHVLCIIFSILSCASLISSSNCWFACLVWRIFLILELFCNWINFIFVVLDLFGVIGVWLFWVFSFSTAEVRVFTVVWSDCKLSVKFISIRCAIHLLPPMPGPHFFQVIQCFFLVYTVSRVQILCVFRYSLICFGLRFFFFALIEAHILFTISFKSGKNLVTKKVFLFTLYLNCSGWNTLQWRKESLLISMQMEFVASVSLQFHVSRSLYQFTYTVLQNFSFST